MSYTDQHTADEISHRSGMIHVIWPKHIGACNLTQIVLLIDLTSTLFTMPYPQLPQACISLSDACVRPV